MLSAALGVLLAAVPLPLPGTVRSFTLTCLDKAREGLNAFGGIGGVTYDREQNHWWMASEGLPLIFPVMVDPRSPDPRPRIGPPLIIHGDPRRETFKKVEALTLCHDRFLIGTEAVLASDLPSGREQDLRVIFADRQGR